MEQEGLAQHYCRLLHFLCCCTVLLRNSVRTVLTVFSVVLCYSSVQEGCVSPQLFNIIDDLWQGRNRHCNTGKANVQHKNIVLTTTKKLESVIFIRWDVDSVCIVKVRWIVQTLDKLVTFYALNQEYTRKQTINTVLYREVRVCYAFLGWNIHLCNFLGFFHLCAGIAYSRSWVTT